MNLSAAIHDNSISLLYYACTAIIQIVQFYRELSLQLTRYNLDYGVSAT